MEDFPQTISKAFPNSRGCPNGHSTSCPLVPVPKFSNASLSGTPFFRPYYFAHLQSKAYRWPHFLCGRHPPAGIRTREYRGFPKEVPWASQRPLHQSHFRSPKGSNPTPFGTPKKRTRVKYRCKFDQTSGLLLFLTIWTLYFKAFPRRAPVVQLRVFACYTSYQPLGPVSCNESPALSHNFPKSDSLSLLWDPYGHLA